MNGGWIAGPEEGEEMVITVESCVGFLYSVVPTSYPGGQWRECRWHLVSRLEKVDILYSDQDARGVGPSADSE